MHTPSWTSDRPTASRCSAVGFVTPPHRAAAGGPSEAEDGRGASQKDFSETIPRKQKEFSNRHSARKITIPVWWRRALLTSLPWVCCFLSFFLSLGTKEVYPFTPSHDTRHGPRCDWRGRALPLARKNRKRPRKSVQPYPGVSGVIKISTRECRSQTVDRRPAQEWRS